MARLNVLTLALYFLYFLSSITGAPAFESGLSPSESVEFRERSTGSFLYAGESAEEASRRLEELSRKETEVRWVWSPGLIERVYVQRALMGTFDDPLLESDSRPEDLLRAMSRSFTSDSFRLGINIFWCTVMVLCLLALRKRHWFYDPMSTMIVSISMLMIGSGLLTARHGQLLLFQNTTAVLAVAALEILLILLGAAVLLRRILPTSPDMQLSETKFMEHMRSDRRRQSGDRTVLDATIEVVVIMGVGLLVANLFLLPVYKLQLSFPGFFALLLLFGVGALTVFYLRAYLRVGRSQAPEADMTSAFAFLGFRMLANTVFLTIMFSLITIILGIVVMLAVYNVLLLQDFSLLPKADSL